MKIKSISLVENQDVYNMAVEDVNCYAVTNSDIILHNCDALRYGIMYMKDYMSFIYIVRYSLKKLWCIFENYWDILITRTISSLAEQEGSTTIG